MPSVLFPSRLAPVLVVTLLAGTMGGCVRRRLTVRTDPPGALVSVDNQVIGTSPAASPFLYYGTRDIRVERDGFQTETVRHTFNPPWYQFPPLDFFVENLWPGEIRDERVIDVQLSPKPIPPVEQVVGRADQLRQQARQGVATPIADAAGLPLTPAPVPAQTLPSSGVPFQPTAP